MNEVENQILMTMLAWLYDCSLVLNDCVLCFDGFLIPKKSGINESILRKLEAEVKRETGYDIKLKVKEMDAQFGL